MKRFGLGLFLIYVLLLVTPKLWAEDDHHRSANALEMGAVGLVAASIGGAGMYLLRRRGGSGK